MPNSISSDSAIFKDLSEFFSVPNKPLTIDEVQAMSASEVKDLLVAVRATR